LSYAVQFLSAHPGSTTVSSDTLAACIEACFDCAQACTACADACLAEQTVADLVRCIRLDQDCADQCLATGQTVTRQTTADPQALRASLAACVDACNRCATECEEHARHGMEHCAVCAEACRRCEQACNALITELMA